MRRTGAVRQRTSMVGIEAVLGMHQNEGVDGNMVRRCEPTRSPLRHVHRSGSPKDAASPRSACDARDDAMKVCEDFFFLYAQDVPAELFEHPIPVSITARAVLVVSTVHLHDETHPGAREVHNERPDDELPPKGEAGLGAGERPPEPLFRPRGGKAHGASALFEEPSLSWIHERASEQEDLRATGADARRAESSVQLACRASWPSRAPRERAARKVRVRSSARIRARRAPHVNPSPVCLTCLPSEEGAIPTVESGTSRG